AYLRHSNTLSCLLQNLFRLMPVRPTAIDSRMQVAHLACWVYRSVLQVLPAAARLWWQGQEKRVAGAVESYTARHVSPCLLALELSAVQRRSNKIPNLTVRARPTAREVLAAYEANEVYVELLVCLPASLPLGVPTVECSRRVAVSPQQWRSWLLQLHAFLKNQNGSIIEGLELWKANVEKRFEGVEECAICFSIIHGTNCSLPCKACRTCRKKFHNACLYKWFSTSNKANCPLCRERFF
uniref:E3 ubiquitin-protein ligase listerin n=1 Tax=Eptatretus burgeri TaxID=7764 RepID=A0A8C4QP95_EPTBU